MAKVDGDLRVYRRCERCAGEGHFPGTSPISGPGFIICQTCDGTGRILTDQISATAAKRRAYATRNAAFEIHGRQGYD